MISIKHEVFPSSEQMIFVIEGMRNPMNSWGNSDSGIAGDPLQQTGALGLIELSSKGIFILGDADKKLMKRLAMAGSDHRKFLRMMPIYIRVTAPLYWWKEFDTYKIGTVSNSRSTMHKIQAKEFTRADFSMEHLDDDAKQKHWELCLDNTIASLNSARERYLSTHDKYYWWLMIQLLPSSYNQTRNIMLNYEVLIDIYRGRLNHKLDEWRDFCKWIETIPYSWLVMMPCLVNNDD